ncbi:MAG: M43 family zinc metalloprotease [Bacteroidota bacterium]
MDHILAQEDDLHFTLRQEQLKLEEDWKSRLQSSKPLPKASKGDDGSKSSKVYFGRSLRTTPPPYTLPVVFHVIHQNGVENLSEDRLLTALEQLNNSFANTGYYDQGTGVNTQIQFCLAQRDPDNQASNGITRTLNPLTEVDNTTDREMKDLARWNPLEYINIYVVREICLDGLGCGVAGYAYLPSAHGNAIDGIVVEARWLGADPADNTVLTHEMGHYLGLYHTFEGGCTNDDCTVNGDRVCDTPPDQSTAPVPCDGEANTCDTDTNSGFATDQPDLFNNYMDYGFFTCYNALTAGQSERMSFFIENRRASLLSSLGCLPPCPAVVDAAISASETPPFEVGQVVTFTSNSTNNATQRWILDGVEVGTGSTLSIPMPEEGFFALELVAASGSNLCAPDTERLFYRVVCSLTAGFTISNQQPATGESIVLNATDTEVDSYAFVLNGEVVATEANPTLVIDSAGLYSICLTVRRDSCQESVCDVLQVGNIITGEDCSTTGDTFVQQIGSDLFPATSGNIIRAANGNYVISGTYGEAVSIQEINASGELVRAYLFNLASGAENIVPHTLQQLADGSFIVAGDLQLFAGVLGFYFRFELETGFIYFADRMSHSGSYRAFVTGNDPDELIAVGSYAVPVNGDYRAQHLRTLNLANGNPTTTLNKNWTSTAEDEFFTKAIRLNDKIYAVGQTRAGSGQRRAIFCIFDLAGNLELQQFLQGAQVFEDRVVDIVTDGERLYLINQSFVNPASVLHCLDQAGNTIYQQRFRNLFVRGLALVGTDELYLYGKIFVPNENVVVKVNRSDGTMIWDRHYWSDLGQLNDNSLAVTPDGGFIVTTTFSDLSSPRHLTFRADADGEIEEECFHSAPYEVTVNTSNGFWTPILQTETTLNNQSSFLSVSRQSRDFLLSNSCGDPCAGQTIECLEIGDNFVQVLGDQDIPARGFQITDDGTGGFYVAGAYGTELAVARMSGNGLIINSFTVSPPEDNISTFAARHIRLLPGGDLLICGNQYPENSFGQNSRGFLTRIDPTTQTATWWRRQSGLGEYVETSLIPGTEQLLLVGNRFVNNNQADPEIFQASISLTTGQDAGSVDVSRSLANEELMYDQTEVNGELWMVGRANIAMPSTDAQRVYLGKYAADGSPIFHLRGHLDGELGGNGVALTATDGSSIFVAYEIAGFGSTETQYLAKFAPDGTQDYLIRVTSSYRNPKALRAIGNDLYLLAERPGTNEIVLVRFRADSGAFNGIRTYSSILGPLGFLYAGDQSIAFSGGKMAFTCEVSLSGDLADNEHVRTIVIKTDLDGRVESDCFLNGGTQAGQIAEDLAWEFFDFPATGTAPASFNPTPLVTNTAVKQRNSCLEDCVIPPDSCQLVDCFPEEICGNGIDDDNNGFVDCEDPNLVDNCCCRAAISIDLGPDTTICPTATAWEIRLPDIFDSLVVSGSGGTDSLVMVIDGPGTYSFAGRDSCGVFYTDTLRVLVFTDTLVLDLGPDRTVCDNAATTLDAGPGWSSYQWSDITTEQSATFFGGGTFSVAVTNQCGTALRDSVTVTVIPTTQVELPDTIGVCPEADSILLSAPGFDRYQWFPRGTVSCLDCSFTRVAPPALGDSLYVTVVTSSTDGSCISSDSVLIFGGIPQGDYIEASTCPGQPVEFAGQLYSAAGRYLNPLDCGVFDTLDLFVFPAPDTAFQAVRICAGDSITLFGNVERTSGRYQQTSQNVNGCDSVSIIDLSVVPQRRSLDTVTICAGDSVELFGGFFREPGLYESAINTPDYPCDSIAGVWLIVEEGPQLSLNIEQECDATTAEVSVSSATGMLPYTFTWSDPILSGPVETVGPGDYQLTVTDASGCTDELDFTVSIKQAVELSVDFTDPNCPGDENGSILLFPRGTATSVVLNNASPVVTDSIGGLAAGTYTLLLTDTLGCTQSQTVTLAEAVSLSLSLPADTLIRLGDSVLLRPQTTGATSLIFQWTPPTGLSCDTCRNVWARPVTNTNYTLMITDPRGCATSADIDLRVDRRERIYVPNAFSPNADGFNDRFTVFGGPEVVEVERLQVYNRWGSLLYEATDFPVGNAAFGWDGTYKGQPLNGGVYVYQLAFRLTDGRVVQRRGEVVLLR